MAERIGLFGGTFDPVHLGHLRPAVELSEYFELSTLFLLPNHRPAHRGPTAASTEMRIEMLNIAVDQVPCLAVDTREARRDKASYTVDSLREIKTETPDATLLFFLGLDAFAAFDTWHEWESILTLSNLIVVNRPDASHSEFSSGLLARQQLRCGKTVQTGEVGVIEECEVTQLAISATDIRRRIATHRSIRFLIPEAVSEYIVSNGLYLEPE